MSKLLPNAFNAWWVRQDTLTKVLLTLTGMAAGIAYASGFILFQATVLTQGHEPYTIWLGVFYAVTLISMLVYLVYLQNKD